MALPGRFWKRVVVIEKISLDVLLYDDRKNWELFTYITVKRYPVYTLTEPSAAQGSVNSGDAVLLPSSSESEVEWLACQKKKKRRPKPIKFGSGL